jgi:hypothetical protein
VGGGENEIIRTAVYRTPQEAVRGYVTGVEGLKGSLLCGSVDSSLRRAMINYTIKTGIAEAGASCATALSGLAKVDSKEGKHHFKLPRLHVAISGSKALVRYIGPRTHKQDTFALIKSGSGWLINKIDGSG